MDAHRSDEQKVRKERQAERERIARAEAKKAAAAITDYNRLQLEQSAKTARLRALRVAKEDAEAEARRLAAAEGAKKPVKRIRKPKVAPPSDVI